MIKATTTQKSTIEQENFNDFKPSTFIDTIIIQLLNLLEEKKNYDPRGLHYFLNLFGSDSGTCT